MHKLSKAFLCLSFCVGAFSAQAENPMGIDKQIEDLKSRIQTLEKKQQSQNQRLQGIVDRDTNKAISINGFMSIGLSQFNKEVAPYERKQDGDLSLLPNTWFGLQMNAELYDGAEFVIQLLAQGDSTGANADSFELDTEWLYVKQNLGAGFDLQAGRIRFPLFQESESFYVGSTYPWVSPPASVYSVLDVTSVDGISVNHRQDLGYWYLETKLLVWADAVLPFSQGRTTLDNLKGLIFNLANDDYSFRLAYMRATQAWDANLNLGPLGVIRLDFGDELDYYVAAMKFDNGIAYSSFEGVQVKAERGTLPEDNSWNSTFGWYFGDVLVYAGHSRTQVDNGYDLAGNIAASYLRRGVQGNGFVAGAIAQNVLNERQRTNMAGIKWNFHPKVTYKLQVSYIYGLDGTIGNFNEAASAGGRITLPENLYLWEMAIQAVF